MVGLTSLLLAGTDSATSMKTIAALSNEYPVSAFLYTFIIFIFVLDWKQMAGQLYSAGRMHPCRYYHYSTSWMWSKWGMCCGGTKPIHLSYSNRYMIKTFYLAISICWQLSIIWPLGWYLSSPVAQCVARRARMQQCVWRLVHALSSS